MKIGEVYGYTTEDTYIDLERTFFTNNKLEPRIDEKYSKRIIRLVFMMALVYYELSIEFQTNYMNHFFDIVVAIYKIYDYIINDNKEYLMLM